MGRRHRSRRPHRESGQGYRYTPPEQYDYPAPQQDDYPPNQLSSHRPRQQDDYLPPVPGDYHLPRRGEDGRGSWSEDYQPARSGDYLPPRPNDNYSSPEGYDYPSPEGYDYPQPEGYDYPPPFPVDDTPLSNEDYNKVRQGNFNVWVKWRTSLNESFLAAINNGWQNLVPPFKVALQEATDSSTGPRRTALLYDPDILMNYSMSTNNVTEMPNDSFLKYGIPRASMNLYNTQYGNLFKSEEDEEEDEKETKKDVVYTVRMVPVREDDNPTLLRKQQTDVIERWSK